ncbi:MAG: elongation factor P [Candidatus Kerfeldbacteria bacterium]|jgi:elongation factor P
MIESNNLRAGVYITLDGDPFVIVKHDFIKMGRGKGVMRITAKNLKTGQTLEKSFKGSEKAEEADISRSKANYLYQEGDNYYFMDGVSFDQFFVTEKQLGEKKKFLIENLEVDVLNFNSSPIGVEIPTKIKYEIKLAPPGVRGDTAQGSVTKKATLETDLVIDVPLFIEQGEKVIVNTNTGKYVGKA